MTKTLTPSWSDCAGSSLIVITTGVTVPPVTRAMTPARSLAGVMSSASAVMDTSLYSCL